MTVYLDLVVMLNFAVDFLLLAGTNRFSGFPGEYRRCAWGALLGGIYGGCCLLPGLRFLGSGIWRLVFLGLIGSAAFGWNCSAVRRIPVFVMLNMALGGLAASSRAEGIWGLLLCGGFLWILCQGTFRRRSGPEGYIPAELKWGGRTVRLYALRDTGNVLSDPVTGEQVLVCGADVGEELLGLSRAWFQDPVGAVVSGKVPGLRLIPYHAVGRSNGMLPAVRLKDAVIGGVRKEPLVAFAPEEIAKGQVYRMLTGGTI